MPMDMLLYIEETCGGIELTDAAQRSYSRKLVQSQERKRSGTGKQSISKKSCKFLGSIARVHNILPQMCAVYQNTIFILNLQPYG